ncbi:MAG: acyl-CoA/acyl-ACP dehydrogenase [Gammaproteobacteria bacterium]|jgi:acyl-CoA dehydrogenase|nr:acyl-CoA/acyl-ACP dehydrogenase [Gammaproteobacteria bacterium]MBT4494424.1 acyl-CoA/acyl-ACP dehydrogenase [Gammaproteobacteria bacterium]
MNEQQQLIKDTLSRLLTDLCTPQEVDAAENGEWAGNLWQTLNETGLALAGVPETAGGSGGDLEDSLLVLHEAARFSAPVPLAEHFIAGLLLAEQGAVVGDAPTTIAVGDFEIDDALNLSGSAENVAFARWCGEIVLAARGTAGMKLCRIAVAETDLTPGLSVAGEPRDTISVSRQLDAANVFDAGDDIEHRIRLMGAATRSVMMAGALESTLEMSVQYSQERSQFGRSISKFQAIQHQLAVMAGEVAASTLAADCIKESFASLNEVDIAIGKARTGEAVSVCTDLAHGIHGAMGYTLEHSLNHRTRRLWCWRDEYGAEKEWQLLIGQKFVAGGADNLWATITDQS